MKRFATALTAALLGVLVIGGPALTLVNGAEDGVLETARGTLLAQAEDDPVDDATDEPAAPQLSSIERLLARLAPSTEGSNLPSAQRVVLSRDPFQPVVPEPVADGGTDDDGDGATDDGTDGGTDDGTDGGTDDGTDGGTDDGTDGDGGEACTGDEQETVCEGIVVTLDGFTDDGEARVSVDGTMYTVGVGDEFATSFRVLAINEPCATLLFGDDSFSICVGATVLK